MYRIVKCCTVRYSALLHSTCTEQRSAVQCSAVLYSAVQCCIVQYSAGLYSAAYFLTVQFSAVRRSPYSGRAVWRPPAPLCQSVSSRRAGNTSGKLYTRKTCDLQILQDFSDVPLAAKLASCDARATHNQDVIYFNPKDFSVMTAE